MSFQADLLSHFGQELIAHGAILFAIVTAAFTFMANMRPKGQDCRRAAIYIVISGVLIGAGLYTLCRILWYGALVNSVMRAHVDAGQDLWSYSLIVVAGAKDSLNARGLFYAFIARFSSSFNDLTILSVCVCAGLSTALLIFFLQKEDHPEQGRKG